MGVSSAGVEHGRGYNVGAWDNITPLIHDIRKMILRKVHHDSRMGDRIVPQRDMFGVIMLSFDSRSCTRTSS